MRLARIIVDESSDLEEDFARRLRIVIIPFNVINKDGKLIRIISGQKENLEQGIFSSKDSFFRHLEKAKRKDDIPTTGAISVERCKEIIREASEGKKDVVCILIPKELSKVYENVERAAELVSADIGNRIEIVDSRQAFSAQYFVVREAAELAEKGKNAEEIAAHVNRVRKRIYLLAAIYDFRYLRKSGRVKKLKKIGSYIADLLKLASIITLKEGVPLPLVTIPRTRVEEKIISKMERITGFNEKISVRINYAGEETRKRAIKLGELIRKKFGGCVKELSSYQTGPLVGSHAGPYTLSVAVRKFGYEKITSFVLAEMFERTRGKLKRNESTLNRLNIYPVIDADTGKNLSFTLRDITKNLDLSSLKETVRQVAFRACENGTGFSGTGMASYLTGFASTILRNDVKKLDAENYVRAMEEGTRSAYLSFRDPKEGTMLSTMRVSTRRARECLQEEKDIAEILKEAYIAAVKELLNPEIQEVPILKRKGIVDAGGLGFIYTLEGWLSALGKERELEDFIEELRKKIDIQKSSLSYKMEEARHPGFCLKIKIEGLEEKEKEKLMKEMESLPNPIESPLSTVSNILHMHVYDEELQKRVLQICSNYGEARLLKASPLSQSDFELLKNKVLTLLGKTLQIPKLIGWSLYWFGLRVVFPFREIKLWKRSRDLILIAKGLEDAAESREEAIFVFDRKGKIKYFNKAAQDYAGELDIEEIKMWDDIILYLHPEFLRKIEGKLFSLGKEEPFLFDGKRHSFKLKQLYEQNEHVGARLEIIKK